MKRLIFLVGLAAGFVLGSRMGRGPYEKLEATAHKVAEDPRVQEKAGQARDVAVKAAVDVSETVKDAAPDLAASAKEKVGDAADSAKAALAGAAGSAKETAADAQRKVGEARHKAEEKAEDKADAKAEVKAEAKSAPKAGTKRTGSDASTAPDADTEGRDAATPVGSDDASGHSHDATAPDADTHGRDASAAAGDAEVGDKKLES
ncbi:hypothetical protein [Brachybacterium huguangmaarense]